MIIENVEEVSMEGFDRNSEENNGFMSKSMKKLYASMIGSKKRD